MATYRGVSELLAMIDAAVEHSHKSHAADIRRLGDFCRSVVDEVGKLCAKVAELKFPHPEVDEEKLAEPLTKCLAYMRARSAFNIGMLIVSMGTRSSEDCLSVSMAELQSEVRATVCDSIIEPVLLACQRFMHTGGSPLQERSSDAATVMLLYAIRDADKVLCLGHTIMKDYDRRIDKLLVSLKVLVDPEQRLLDKIEHAAGAIRVAQESGRCPHAFFLVPRAVSKAAWFKSKLRSFNVFHKNMELYFLCHMVFDDLRNAASKTNQKEQTVIELVGSREMSLPLDVKIPRGFVTKWMPVIKLTLEIVNVFIHAAASAVGVGPFIPGLTLSEHQDLLGVLKTDFDAVLEIERSSKIAPEDGKQPCRLADELEGMSLHGSARQIMQKYLDDVHLATWNTKILENLQLATNKKLEVAYVCNHDDKHLDAWMAKS